MAENASIIIDLGGKDIKAGYASGWPTDEEPRLASLMLVKHYSSTHHFSNVDHF